MPSIKLTDPSSAGVDLALSDHSVLGAVSLSSLRFDRGGTLELLAQPLDHIPSNALSFAFSYAPSITLPGGSATFSGGLSPTGELELMQPVADGTSLLFPADQFGRSVPMGHNVYLALSFALVVSGSLPGTGGEYLLMLNTAAKATAKLHCPFARAADGSYPTLKVSLERVFSAFSLPSSAADLLALPVGSVFTLDTQGSVSFKTTLNLLAAVNPTASPGFSAGAGPLAVSAGPSVTVSGGFTVTGAFQVRLWKRDDHTLELGYFKKRDSTFQVSFEAAEAAGLSLGGYDLIAKLYALLGDSGQLPADWLKSNVPPTAAAEVSEAYKAAVETKLSLECNAECDTSLTDQAAFSWSFDLALASGAAATALHQALQGNLAPLLTGPLPEGVRAVGSILDRVRESKRAFTLNFLGLFDYASVEDVARSFTAKVSEDGQLVLTDSAHLERLQAEATPFVKAAPLQSVMAEDCAATVAYAVSFGHFVPQLKFTYSYFVLQNKARTGDLQLFLAIAAQLAPAADQRAWFPILAAGARSQTASLLVGLTYDPVRARSLFLDRSGQPRAVSDFQAVSRRALGAEPGQSLNPAFLRVLGDDALWQTLVAAGSPGNVYLALGADVTNPPPWAVLSFNWVVHIERWAAAMHDAAQSLAAMAAYLAKDAVTDPLHDPAFTRLRQTLVTKFSNAIKNTPMFNDSLGVLTMAGAAQPASTTITVSYASQTTVTSA